jgi:dTMP kinase
MKFIVIDGLDGSGKDTQAKMLYNDFKNNGTNVVLRSHPSKDNKYGRKSKEAVTKRGKINHLKATIYFAFDVIRSLIKYYNKKDIDVLIFSRYTLAVAYLPNSIYIFIYKIVSIVLPVSDYMFFLDIDPHESLKRVAKRGEAEEMFENEEALIIARSKALNVLNKWIYINANKNAEDINNEIKEICFEE